MNNTKIAAYAVLSAVLILAVVFLLLRPSEAERLAELRKVFSESFSNKDYEMAAKATNDYSRVMAHTLDPSLTLNEIFPIGGTIAYPLQSIDITGDFIERRLFYYDIASSITKDATSMEQKILAIFNWIVETVWPSRSWNTKTGLTPREIAIAGVSSSEEIVWLFCILLESLNMNGVLFNIDFKNNEESLELAAVEHVAESSDDSNARWFLFHPVAGVPLLVEDTQNVATIKDLLNSKARLPGCDIIKADMIKSVKIHLVSEAECFLPAAGDLEELLPEQDIYLTCHHKSRHRLNTLGDSIVSHAKGSETKIEDYSFSIWSYPFHLAENRSETDKSFTFLEKNFSQARKSLILNQSETTLTAIAKDKEINGHLLVAIALLELKRYDKVIETLRQFEGKDYEADIAAYVSGHALLGLNRNGEAAKRFGEIKGKRSIMGQYYAGKTELGEKPVFFLAEK